jgi:oligopeptide/dipeptide ABC transporter ATP-binding protein
MSGDAILRVRDLSVEIAGRRGTVRPVNDVSLEVSPGEALGLVGESGCGKTMTLRAVAGLLPPAAEIVSGQILFEGRDLTAMTEAELNDLRGAGVAMIFQEPMTALNPVMRVGEQIAEGPQVHLGMSSREARRHAVELLARVGLPDPERRAHAYPHELSGGMRQRVMIAIAIACAPRLILCDEPTTALDVTIQDQILRLLGDLRSELGAALVFVTHDLAVVAQTCDRLCVMYAGQVVEEGLVADLFKEPRHPYTMGLLRSVPDFDQPRQELESIPGAPPDLARPPAGCRFHPRCSLMTEECRVGPIPLMRIDGRRQTACIHHERLVAQAVAEA